MKGKVHLANEVPRMCDQPFYIAINGMCADLQDGKRAILGLGDVADRKHVRVD